MIYFCSFYKELFCSGLATEIISSLSDSLLESETARSWQERLFTWFGFFFQVALIMQWDKLTEALPSMASRGKQCHLWLHLLQCKEAAAPQFQQCPVRRSEVVVLKPAWWPQLEKPLAFKPYSNAVHYQTVKTLAVVSFLGTSSLPLFFSSPLLLSSSSSCGELTHLTVWGWKGLE